MQTVAIFIKHQFSDIKFTLIMDRTNWKYGKTHINILFLAMGYNNFTIPIFWSTLPQNKKSGNSNTHERIELIKKFISIFGIEMIKYLTGDREFIGKLWFKYLIDNNIKFVIRLKYNTKVSRINGGFSPVKNFFIN